MYQKKKKKDTEGWKENAVRKGLEREGLWPGRVSELPKRFENQGPRPSSGPLPNQGKRLDGSRVISFFSVSDLLDSTVTPGIFLPVLSSPHRRLVLESGEGWPGREQKEKLLRCRSRRTRLSLGLGA